MKQIYPLLLHEDIAGIPSGMVRERQDMLLYLRPIHTTGSTADSMGIQELMYLLKEEPQLYPKYQEMSHEKRLHTLLTAGCDISQLSDHKMQDIVRAGFFHSGTDATLTCYHCGCNAVDWHDDDDPWLRHMELQPNCPVIKRSVVKQESEGRPAYCIMRRSISCPEAAVCETYC